MKTYVTNQFYFMKSFNYFQSDLTMENAFKEKEAYELQNKFLEELSIKNDMIDVLNIKKCRSNQYN